MPVFHEHLKAWRLAKGMTQEGLAQKSGIPRPNIVAIEQGRRDCTVTTLRRLAVALGVSPGILIDQSPPARIQALGRHEIDRIARSILFQDCNLPASLEPIRRKAAFQAQPLLRVAGIRSRVRKNSQTSPGDHEAVDQVLKRISKLLPSVIAGRRA